MHFTRTQGTILLAGFLTYVVMGALVFEILEKDHNIKMEEEMLHLKEEFFLNYSSLTPAEVELFIVKMVAYIHMGLQPGEIHARDKKSSTWDFANSFFFVGTMLATIGYGNVCPQTKEGQIFCVVFALFGIPFNLICLNYIGFLVSGLFESCAEKVCGKGNKKTAGYIFFFLILGILIFLILPSFFFTWIEGWSYSESVYYTFITLSTIGFGDYLIGRKHDRTYFQGYHLLASIWIIIGLAWLAVLFELASSFLAFSKESPQKKKSKR